MNPLPQFTEAQIERMKREARAIKRHTGEKHGIVLNRIAREEGYRDWATLMHDGYVAPKQPVEGEVNA